MYRLPDISFVIHYSSNLQSFHWSGLTLPCSLPPSLPCCWVFLWGLGMAHCVQNLVLLPATSAAGLWSKQRPAGTAAPPAS